MAFFGLTQLGPQNPFRSTAKQTISVLVFEDQDFITAFNRVDSDKNGFLMLSDLSAVMNRLYKGFPPESETEALRDILSASPSGRFNLDEFISAAHQLQGKISILNCSIM